MDDFRDFTGAVVARVGEFVHVGWVHSYSFGNRGGRARDQFDHRTPASALDGTAAGLKAVMSSSQEKSNFRRER